MASLVGKSLHAWALTFQKNANEVDNMSFFFLKARQSVICFFLYSDYCDGQNIRIHGFLAYKLIFNLLFYPKQIERA